MNKKDRTMLANCLRDAQDSIQMSNIAATDPYVLSAIEELLQAVKLIVRDMDATNLVIAETSQP